MDRKMSDIQTKIYDFIEEYTRREGRPPTNREIGHDVGILSTGHVDYHLSVLEKKGYIIRDRKKSRGIRVAQTEPAGLPIQGTIAAGVPLDIFPETEVRSGLDLSTHRREYVLQVRGESMIEDHIADGDYVLVLPIETADNGDIIVATHMDSASSDNGAATLKRFYREPGKIRLQPANATMEPIYIDADEWTREWKIQGKVTAVYRRC